MNDSEPYGDSADALLAFAEDGAASPPRSVLVIVAHPDDEVIGAGTLMARLTGAGAAVDLVHVTDGAPRNLDDARAAGFDDAVAYARQRRRELRSALEAGRVGAHSATTFGIPDQRASFRLALLIALVAKTLDTIQPAVVLTHPYEGGHPDHDATAFAVHTAMNHHMAAGRAGLVELSSYNGLHDQLHVCGFLAGGERPVTLVLNAAEHATKRAMLRAFVTQRRTLAQFPIHVERFRRAPRYDFSQPPHAGTLWFEHFDWGVRGDEWRRLAREALTSAGAVQPWSSR